MIARLKAMGNITPSFDLEPADLPPDQMSYAKNYLLRDGKVYAFNGENVIASFNGPLSGAATYTLYGGYIDYVTAGDVKYFLVAGRNSLSTTKGIVQVTNGTTWTDISNADGYASLAANDELLWTGCKLGSIPIINNPKHFPEYWSPQNTSQKMQYLMFDATHTWKDKGYRANVIRSHNNFLFALGLTEGGIELPNAYRWSHPADINGLPFTWDETDLSAIASKESVEGLENRLVDGLSLRDAFALYSTRSMYVLDYVGGEFVWQRRKLSQSHGVLTTNCVVEAVGNHIVLTDGDIVINDGNSITSLLTSKMKRYLEKNLSNDSFNNCFAQVNYIDNEAWFFIVQPSATYPSIAFVVNYNTGQISLRDVQGKKVSATFGQTLKTAQTWDTIVNTWRNVKRTYQESEASPFNDSIIVLDTGPATAAPTSYDIVNIEENSTVNPIELLTVLERTCFDLEGQETVTTIVRVYPHIRSTGSVLIQFGSHSHMTSPISWKPPVVYTPNSMRQVNLRTTGELHAWRISSIDDVPFEFTGMDIEYQLAGFR